MTTLPKLAMSVIHIHKTGFIKACPPLYGARNSTWENFASYQKHAGFGTKLRRTQDIALRAHQVAARSQTN
ncbi:hypothetical protein BTUL_0009g00690 [Botrytis tulipae]|uniref:Uncharacterized protein n=1 Tax=Botrytis tulipae TaxID=87230 RepID=A0A4Z1F4B8_9HELO|nr:hypothetical protein BTUL_0009g00690 [Botrytis tulipae]